MTTAILAKMRRSEPLTPVRRLAFASGGVLRLDSSAPRTLSEALVKTARALPQNGLRFVAQGQESFESYGGLLERARRVATGLGQNGLRAGDRVILQLETLAAHYAAFWGCVLAGIAPVTVAVAPTYKERNGIVNKLYNTWTLLDQPAVITTQRLAPALSRLGEIVPMDNLRVLCLEDLLKSDPADALHRADPEDVAFLQLSSGSTGVPKCIQETHEGILTHVFAAKSFNRYSTDEVTLNWLPLDHVVPILTFHLRDVCLGYQQIHVQPDIVLADPLAWFDLIEAHKVTQTWAPNFGFKLASDRASRTSGRKWDLSSIKFFMNAGEQVTMPVLRSFLEAVVPFGVRPEAMQPAFGMAEVCTCMTYANQFSLRTGAQRFLKSSLDGLLEPTVERNGSSVEFVSLGPPVPGVSIRITDSADRLLPEGVIGRLQIKGKVVTPGYLNNPEANAEAFVGGGWFNTGDLGFIHDGELFLTGREKELIIIRGTKFYCYEIEDVANQVPGVAPTFCAVCSIADATAGTEKLAIFFVPEPDSDPIRVAEEVRSRVSALMGVTPGYIIPLARTDFPKTTSGKIQRTQLRKALEAGGFKTLLEQLERKSSSSECAQPAAGTETRVARIWQEVLGLADLPVNKSLFAMGGDSLKAIQIISRLREVFRVEFPLANLFEEDATIRGMAEWIEHNHQEAGAGALPPVDRAANRDEFPASPSQLRIWLADQMDPGTSSYNVCRVLSLRGALDTRALEVAVNGIVQRHEILRTVFVFDGSLNQRVVPDCPMALPIDDLRALSAATRESEAQTRVIVEANRCFDLLNGPLFRAKLFILDDTEHLLLLRFHQIIVDGWSIPIFYRELAELYQASIEGRPAELAPLPVQYGDYSAWQQRWMTDSHLKTQFDYWRDRVTADHPESELNLAKNLDSSGHRSSASAPPATSRAGATVEALILGQALVAALREFNAHEGQTLFVTLLAAFKLLLHRWSGCHEIVVGSATAGRTRLETEGLIGFFVNTLTLRTDVSGARTFHELVRRVRETSAGAFAHSEAPFERLSRVHGPVKTSARHRWFQVWFSPIDPQTPFDLGPAKASPQLVFPRGAQFDLSLFISELPGALACYFEYKEGLYDRDWIARFASEYENLLREVIADPNTPLERA